MSWYLLWPHLHRLVIVNFQDARYDNDSCILGPFGGPLPYSHVNPYGVFRLDLSTRLAIDDAA